MTTKGIKLGLEQLESRDVPSTFNTIHTNPIAPAAINGNAFSQVLNGDFDNDGQRDDLFFFQPGTGANRLVQNVNTAAPIITNNVVNPGAINGEFSVAVSGNFNPNSSAIEDIFFWDPVSGHNRIVRHVGPSANPQVVVDNLVTPTAINGNDFSQVVSGNFDNGTFQNDLFFFKPGTGKNRAVRNIDSFSAPIAAVVDSPISAAAINGAYTTVVKGDFNTAAGGDELFFLDPTTGNNRQVSNVIGANTFLTNNVAPNMINGSTSTVVAGNLDPAAGDELYIWDPASGANRLVLNVGGAATFVTNPVDEVAINGNAFKKLVTGAVVDATAGLFFWDPAQGRNFAIDT